MFDSPRMLLLGLTTGFVFGYLLQKGRVAKFEVMSVSSCCAIGRAEGHAHGCRRRLAGRLRHGGGRSCDAPVKPALLAASFWVASCSAWAWRCWAIALEQAWRPAARADAMRWSASSACCLAQASMCGVSYAATDHSRLGDWGKVTLPEVTGTSPWFGLRRW